MRAVSLNESRESASLSQKQSNNTHARGRHIRRRRKKKAVKHTANTSGKKSSLSHQFKSRAIFPDFWGAKTNRDKVESFITEIKCSLLNVALGLSGCDLLFNECACVCVLGYVYN